MRRTGLSTVTRGAVALALALLLHGAFGVAMLARREQREVPTAVAPSVTRVDFVVASAAPEAAAAPLEPGPPVHTVQARVRPPAQSGVEPAPAAEVAAAPAPSRQAGAEAGDEAPAAAPAPSRQVEAEAGVERTEPAPAAAPAPSRQVEAEAGGQRAEPAPVAAPAPSPWAGAEAGSPGAQPNELQAVLARAAAACGAHHRGPVRGSGLMTARFCFAAASLERATLEHDSGDVLLDQKTLRCIREQVATVPGAEGCFSAPLRYRPR